MRRGAKNFGGYIYYFFQIVTVLACLIFWLQNDTNTPVNPTLENSPNKTYDRVMQTKTLRCGYGVWPPFIDKDANTGKMSGIFYEYVEALGKNLGIKMIWSTELGTGEFISALQSGRIDAMCASIWPNAVRAKDIDFVRPVYFSPIYAYARSNDY